MVEVKKFYGSWCAPCRLLTPVLLEVRTQFPNVRFTDIDVDNNRAEVDKYGVRGVPTVIVEKDGQVVDRFTGVMSKQTYINSINSAMN